MAVYEVLADVDVKRLDNTGFTHYYGKRPGHTGQLIDDKIISNHDLDVLKRNGAIGDIATKAVEPEVKAEPKADKLLDKFGKEIYFCEKCEKNHRIESKIGKAHK